MYVRSVAPAPALTWIDDLCGGSRSRHREAGAEIQWKSANQMVYIFSMFLSWAGYFVNLDKSDLRPVQLINFLGIMSDSKRGMFLFLKTR